MKNSYSPLIKYAVNSLIATAFGLFFVYSSLVVSIVFHAIERKEAISETRKLASILGTLEAEFANKVSGVSDISLDMAMLSKVDNAKFIVMKDVSVLYTFFYEK